jgi:hypothetical protein
LDPRHANFDPNYFTTAFNELLNIDSEEVERVLGAAEEDWDA